MHRAEIRSQSCKEKSFYPNHTDPLVWFPFHCLSLFYSCAFSWKLFREAIPWCHAKKMSEYNYVTQQRSWKRTQPQSLLVSCFLPFKSHFVCSLKTEAPNPSSSGSSICQSAQWHWAGKCMQNWGPPRDVGGPSGSGVQLWGPAYSPEPPCLRSHILQSRWGTELPSIGFLRNPLENLLSTSFLSPCLIQTCLQGSGNGFS